MQERAGSDADRRSSSPWYWLLLVPFPAVLWVPAYNRVDPVILGFPFFYAYQIMAVLLTAILTGVVYWATRSR